MDFSTEATFKGLFLSNCTAAISRRRWRVCPAVRVRCFKRTSYASIYASTSAYTSKSTAIDDKLLDYVFANQLKLLGRKNLSRDEVRMLQIRTVRQKFDKVTGQQNGNTVQLSAAKFVWDGMGGKVAKTVSICDRTGQVLPGGAVASGDVVAATMYANQIYTGVGGDKFGIHWSFDDVSSICQRSKLEHKTEVSAFQNTEYAFAQDYTMPAPQTFGMEVEPALQQF